MGYVFHEHDWTGPPIPATFEADVLHTLLVLRAEAIEGCTENSEDAREFAMIALATLEGSFATVLGGQQHELAVRPLLPPIQKKRGGISHYGYGTSFAAS
jgi:hypothetical protein